MQVTEITNYNLKSQTILNESWNVLTEAQRIHIGTWEKTLWPLMESYSKLLEAELTPKQIDAIFTSAEASAAAGGNNKTVLGKAGGSIAKQTAKITDTLNKLATQAQNSGPIKNFDAQFEKLKLQLKKQLQGNPVGQKVLKGIESWGDFAKESPAKSAFIIGAMTSLLAFASGGILSGAAIGFFIKMANNTMKGDKLSTAVGKGVKGAAIGAVAGALGGAIKDLLPGDVTQTLINSASGEIDVDGLSAMDATSITDLDAESAKDLVQTRGALAEIIKSDLDADASKLATDQLAKLDAKILELAPDAENLKGAIDQVQSEFDIKGTDTEIRKYGSEVKDADGVGTGELETEVVAKIDAEQLNANGINSADYPDNEWVTANTEKLLDAGLTQENIDEIQRLQGLDRAIAQDEYLGVNMSAENSIQVGDDLQADGVPENVKVGEVFKSNVTKTLDDGTVYGGTAQVSIEGVDADGNIVYKLEKAVMMPNSMTKELEQILENLPDGELKDTIWGDVLNPNTSGSMTTDLDTTLQKIAQATAAVAIGSALATAEVIKGKPEQGELDLKGGQGVKNTESIDYEEAYTHLFEQFIAEAPPKQGELPLDNPNSIGSKIGKAAMGAGSSLLKTVNKGVDAVGAAAQKGIGKTVAGVKDAGKQLANKVTKEKLMKAWKGAGSPTDTGAVMNILSDNGLADEQIVSIGQSNKVELDPKTKAPEPTADKPVDADGDGKDDNTGDPIPKDDAQAGDAPKDADGDGFDDADVNKDGKVSPDEKSKANYSGGMDNIKASEKMLTSLADEIKKAGVAAEVKAMLLGTKKPPVGAPKVPGATKVTASTIPPGGPPPAPVPPAPLMDV